MKSTLWMGVACGALAGVLGCASTPPPEDALARAEALIRSARQDGASEHAALALRRAEDALEQARLALRGERHVEARRSAEKAAVDAELASAESRRIRAQLSTAELERTLAALRQEIDHDSR